MTSVIMEFTLKLDMHGFDKPELRTPPHQPNLRHAAVPSDMRKKGGEEGERDGGREERKDLQAIHSARD